MRNTVCCSFSSKNRVRITFFLANIIFNIGDKDDKFEDI